MRPDTRNRLIATAVVILVLTSAASVVAAAAGWRTLSIVSAALVLVLLAAAGLILISRRPRPTWSSTAAEGEWVRLLDSLPMAALLVDEEGIIAHVSRPILEFLREPESGGASIEGKSLNEAFLPPYFGNWTPQLEKASLSSQPIRYPAAQYFMEDRAGVCRVWISPIKLEPSRKGLYLIFIEDVTEEAMERSALLEARDREMGIFEGVPVKIAVLDRNFRLVRCNRLMQQWIQEACGLQEPTIPGLPALDIMPREFRPDWKHILRRVLVEGRAFEQPRVHQTVGGTEFFHRVRLHPLTDEAGNIREALLLYEDVTEYVRLERRLAETTDYLNLLIESLNDGFYAMDADGRFTFCNKAFLDMLGLDSSEELYKRGPLELVITEEEDKISRMMERRRRGETVFFETFLQQQDGGALPVQISSAPLFRSGRFMGIVGIAHDLSERRRLEAMVEQSHQDLERAYEELSVLDKMKSDFIAIASHELRTPLSIIKGYADAFQFDELGELTDFQKEKVKIMNARADQMTKIINDLLDVTRLEEGRLVGEKWPAPVEELIINAVSEYKGKAAQAGQAINYYVEEGLPPVSIDVWRVHQVMENLIGNAMKFTPEGGEIVVSARGTADPAMVEIEVSDTGPGIPEREHNKLFTMFYQIETDSTRSAGGLGLGLVISKGIVEGHGGHIWVESEEGTGSSFKFTLPFLKEE
jgi:PAS domain S-box-containing protein